MSNHLDYKWIEPSLVILVLDFGLVVALVYIILLLIGEGRTKWMVQGLILLMLAEAISKTFKLVLLSFVLEKLVLGSAVAIAVVFQAEFRKFLEQLGQGKFTQLLPTKPINVSIDKVLDEIVEAIKELSQKRTGALIVLETNTPIDEGVFSVPGVQINAEVSKELLLTIFQTTTLLHDGAVFISSSRIAAAGVILPLSDRPAPRQWGTRHRAAMGITERVDCLCIVVSEETGSISLAEKGSLNRPLTSNKLKELLEVRYFSTTERKVTPQIDLLSRKIGSQGRLLLQRIFRLPSSTSKDNK
ncbi:MAG: diadenylate cyclase CdaA [Gomphosphaeria aponina SAG 52.96 = DSM 107014]|uniref:Diadenylate cyclase n=1 Tax=Gomphosphaeria aponina SAG 52.96 = DSM 107014 TaxID=1521640 RepID=A0A941JMQ5_9CHRO|nr:diadenylate cyclase CdaA [Gomphosphaeria aponina SAG 52.96 = DSM 107014]